MREYTVNVWGTDFVGRCTEKKAWRLAQEYAESTFIHPDEWEYDVEKRGFGRWKVSMYATVKVTAYSDEAAVDKASDLVCGGILKLSDWIIEAVA